MRVLSVNHSMEEMSRNGTHLTFVIKDRGICDKGQGHPSFCAM